MRLTAMTDFALRLLMHLAQQPGERLCTIAEVARSHDISQAHLMKIAHQLGLQGFVETVRGKGGGLRLARPAHRIGLGEVVRGMEADFRLAECFSSKDGRCALAGACRLSAVLDEALGGFLRHLDRFTLADIAPAAGVAGGAAASPVREQPLQRFERARAKS